MFRGPTLVSLAVSVSVVVCFGAGAATAQFFPFFQPQNQPQNQPQYQPRYQPQSRPKPRPATPPKPRPEATAPPVTTPYDHDLRRLSEILGALHYLRTLCGANDGQKWRDEAQALIEAETPTGPRHDQMVQSFNRGYLGFKQSYRTCTPAANLVIRRYLQEGASIARDVTARYAN
jgi:uncharacterized protein (TIGR02301 family)